MDDKALENLLTQTDLDRLFPKERSDSFFDALYGDASEGAYDIQLAFKEKRKDALQFEFHLVRRRGKCLACNLTYGLPKVFSRHPVINLKGLVRQIDRLLDGKARCAEWKLGHTLEISRDLHLIPLTIRLAADESA